MLNKDELSRLQKLAAISLDQQESEKLLHQL
jgi:Asp-tRNA(Asn)/Glu-tRNA(Gln) amidotransferase C subunit